jgi:simple sugar transport system substrate-binding protein
MKVVAVAVCLIFLLCGCAQEDLSVTETSEDEMIVVGFSQVGAESEWRVSHTESIKTSLSEENGYELLFDDGRNETENQILAIRTFIQQNVDYIVFSARVETGWNSILQEVKDAGIPVIVIDRHIDVGDESLYTAYIGSDFYEEGDKAVKWLEDLLKKRGRTAEQIKIVHIQGTLDSSAQIGRTAALEQAVSQNPNWHIIAQECGDFTRAKSYEVMSEILKTTKDIDVVYCENDGEAVGVIDAMEEAGLKCNTEDGVIVISFDATRLGLEYCLKGKIGLTVECNPLQGPYVNDIIQKLNRGEPIERETYIEETQFDCFNITQEMIDSRGY